MILVSFKVFVGVLLMTNFSLPLTVIASNRRLHTESMNMLVLNMVTYYIFGTTMFLIGMADVLYPDGVPPPTCAATVYISMAFGVGLKTATLFLAVDQFIAVVHSLRYCAIMDVWTKRFITINWICIALMALLGLTCYQLDLETNAEFYHRLFGIQPSDEECRLVLMAHASTVVFELAVFFISITSAALFIYTAIQGVKQERRISRSNSVDTSSRFFLRFKSFKRIVRVLLTLLAPDIIGAGFRIASGWFPQLAATQLLHLVRLICLVIEGWTYGLSSPAVRTAIANYFGFRRGRVAPAPAPVEAPA